jgi:hypothetical protein
MQSAILHPTVPSTAWANVKDSHPPEDNQLYQNVDQSFSMTHDPMPLLTNEFYEITNDLATEPSLDECDHDFYSSMKPAVNHDLVQAIPISQYHLATDSAMIHHDALHHLDLFEDSTRESDGIAMDSISELPAQSFDDTNTLSNFSVRRLQPALNNLASFDQAGKIMLETQNGSLILPKGLAKPLNLKASKQHAEPKNILKAGVESLYSHATSTKMSSGRYTNKNSNFDRSTCDKNDDYYEQEFDEFEGLDFDFDASRKENDMPEEAATMDLPDWDDNGIADESSLADLSALETFYGSCVDFQ